MYKLISICTVTKKCNVGDFTIKSPQQYLHKFLFYDLLCPPIPHHSVINSQTHSSQAWWLKCVSRLFIPRSHSYCLSLLLCLEWYNRSVTPPVQSRLRITNRSFQHAAPQLWNTLPHSLRVPYQSGSSLSSSLSSGSNPEPAVNLSHGMFHSRFKTYRFSKSFPP